MNRRLSRRRLLGHGLGAAAAGVVARRCLASPADAPPASAPLALRRSGVSPNDQIGVGIIGCGRRNSQLAVGIGGQGAPPKQARIVAVADLNGRRAAAWAAHYKCPAFDDYRKLLERKEVDVVVYATPEHWHYLPCIHAAQAGKDMYGEQPLSHTIREGRVMVEAVRKHNVVFQTGEQQRSNAKTRLAAELIINGRIGAIQRVIAYNYPSPFESDFPAQPVPETLDWDRWCGPNEVVPYNVNLYVSRVPYEPEAAFPPEPAEQTAAGPGWMSFRPYSGGELLNWGCHGLSMVQWALQMDQSGPVEVWVEPAEKLETFTQRLPGPRDHGDAVGSRSVINYRYANGVVLTLSSLNPRVGGGATFIGDKGEITIIRGSYECKPKGLDKDPLPPDAIRLYESDNHMQNFYDCVYSRKEPIMNIEAAHRVASLCHLGNIARWLGRRLQWDPDQELFPGDDEANGYLDIPRRKGYELPENV
ncbi:MAG: gfo/Idh/MocA family oxidoreductase [Planctomycetota bacterium]|nr:MAG: gfo/Idh/MocA family oxidoreductase [Planctomycetota bacterium]